MAIGATNSIRQGSGLPRLSNEPVGTLRLDMKRLLFTGAGGFIGRRAMPYLLERGFEVHAVDVRPIDVAGCTVHTANLLEPSEIKRVISTVRPTHLLHLAWYVEHGKFWTSPDNTRWVEASIALLREFASY